MFTNAGKAIIMENLNFCKIKIENELNLRILLKYCLNISLFAFESKFEFFKLAKKIFPGVCNTAALEKSILT
jgi:hypothetical protein